MRRKCVEFAILRKFVNFGSISLRETLKDVLGMFSKNVQKNPHREFHKKFVEGIVPKIVPGNVSREDFVELFCFANLHQSPARLTCTFPRSLSSSCARERLWSERSSEVIKGDGGSGASPPSRFQRLLHREFSCGAATT